MVQSAPTPSTMASSPSTPRRNNGIKMIAAMILTAIVAAIVLGVTLGGRDKKSSSSSQSSMGNMGGENNGETSSSSPPPSLFEQTSSPPQSLRSPTANPTLSPSSLPTDAPITRLPPPTPPTLAPTIFITTRPTPGVEPPSDPGVIVSGTTSNNIDYLSCRSDSSDASKQIVLLHGAAFTKETWLSDNMLEFFCASSEVVVALDLSVGANHQGLIEVLDALRNSNPPITTAPVTLVTPSASGYTIVDWMRNGNVNDIPEYISEWVPVATGSLVSATDDEVAALQNVEGLSILAINGNEDSAGGRYSSRLAELADATAVELVGRHAVYLQSPDDFVQTILNFDPNPTTPSSINTSPIPPSPTDSPTQAPVNISSTSQPISAPQPAPSDAPISPTMAPLDPTPGAIVSGTTSNNVNYLSCSGSGGSNKDKQIVLLHGSSFSKETWLSDGMLDSFCAGSKIVVALDLSTGTNRQGLIQVLEALSNSNPPITTSPVTLVTPSASGYTIIDWMRNGNVNELPQYVSEWVPVATGSLVSATDEEVTALQNVEGLSILAINGNEDSAGGRYSSRLAELADATAVELVGRHAVYLQSPDDFVQTILDF